MEELIINETSIELLDGHHGRYIPQFFMRHFWHLVQNQEAFSDELRNDLRDPDGEWYDESWSTILDTAILKIGDNFYTLHQDSDLWAILTVEEL